MPRTMTFLFAILALTGTLAVASDTTANQNERAASLRTLADQRSFQIGALANLFFTDSTNGDYVSPLRSDPAYRSTLGSEYNLLVVANELMMEITQPRSKGFAFSAADEVVAFGGANGMVIRATPIVWDQLLPDWFTQGDWSKGKLKKLMKKRVKAMVEHYRGRVHIWEVVNEPVAGFMEPTAEDGILRETIWSPIGPQYVELAFKIARKADPEAVLCLNDNFHEDAEGDCCSTKSDKVYDLVKKLAKKGLVDCVGFQMHRGLDYSPEGLAENMRRYADLGVEVQITEMDVAIPLPVSKAKLKKQARIYREVLEICLAEPNCSTFATWGFTDRFSWIPFFLPGSGGALVFDENYGPKPAYKELRKALKKAPKK